MRDKNRVSEKQERKRKETQSKRSRDSEINRKNERDREREKGRGAERTMRERRRRVVLLPSITYLHMTFYFRSVNFYIIFSFAENAKGDIFINYNQNVIVLVFSYKQSLLLLTMV